MSIWGSISLSTILLLRHQQLATAQVVDWLPAWYGPEFTPTDSFEYRARFTEEVQQALWQHQNPADCSDKQFIVFHANAVGLASCIHQAGSALAYAYEKGAILKLAPDACRLNTAGEFCTGQRNLECFIAPLSSCDAPKAQVIADVGTFDTKDAIPSRWRDQLRGSPAAKLYWWRAQAAAYIARLNAKSALRLQTLRSSVAGPQHQVQTALPPNTISVHVGQGGTAKGVQTWQTHLEAAERLARDRGFSERFIFLSSEDPQVLVAAQQTPGWSVFVVPARSPTADIQRQGSEHFFHTLENLFTALECSHFVGTRGSHWNRLIDVLRAVWPGQATGCCNLFVEVGCKEQPVDDLQRSHECDLTATHGNW